MLVGLGWLAMSTGVDVRLMECNRKMSSSTIRGRSTIGRRGNQRIHTVKKRKKSITGRERRGEESSLDAP